MFRRSTFLKTRNSTHVFQLLSRLACTGTFLLTQSFAWAEEAEVSNEAKELETLVVVGTEDEAMVLEQSAAAVDVIDLKSDQKLTADLSEVLSREPGISIRRMGGARVARKILA